MKTNNIYEGYTTNDLVNILNANDYRITNSIEGHYILTCERSTFDNTTETSILYCDSACEEAYDLDNIIDHFVELAMEFEQEHPAYIIECHIKGARCEDEYTYIDACAEQTHDRYNAEVYETIEDAEERIKQIKGEYPCADLSVDRRWYFD